MQQALGRAGRLWAQATGAGARGELHGRARGARRQLGGRRAGRARGECGRARQAHGLGARAGYGLCTRCTRPAFDPN